MPNRFRAYQRIAEELDGTADVDTGLLTSTFTLRARLRGTRIDLRALDHPYSRVSDTQPISADHTIVLAPAQGARGLGVLLLPRLHAPAPLRKSASRRLAPRALGRAALGWLRGLRRARRVEARFDGNYRAMASDEDWALTWIGESTPLLWEPGWTIEIRDQQLTAWTRDFTDDYHRLMRIIEGACGLSSARAAELELEWAELARAVGGRIEDGVSDLDAAPFAPGRLLVRRASRQVVIRCGFRKLDGARRLCTEIACARPPSSSGWLDIDSRFSRRPGAPGSPRIEGKPQALVAAARQAILEPWQHMTAGGRPAWATLAADVRLRVAGLMPSAEVAEAAIAAALGLASVGGSVDAGPYR